jgi:hypothetical protein
MHATKIMVLEVPENLYHDFVNIVTKKEGPWRNRRKPQTFNEAVKSAVTTALTLFLKNLENENRLPEFCEYMREQYPELDEDLITMIQDLVNREKEKVMRVNTGGSQDNSEIPSFS